MTSANKAGLAAENMIADLLRRHHCEFLRQVPLDRSVYGHRIRADFLVENIEEFPHGLVIESKWQDRYGTTDEKFPYVVENILAGGYGPHAVLVVATGGGHRAGAIEWLRMRVDGDRLIGVFSFEDLLSWVQRSIHVRIMSLIFE